jgi:hypothetical protein
MKIQQIDFRDTANHVQDMIQRLIQVGFVVTHGSYCKGRFLPQIIVFNFSNGNIELVPDPVLQAANRVPLGLERTAFRNVHFYGTDSDKHRITHADDYSFAATLSIT